MRLPSFRKFHDAELKGIFGFTTNSTTVFGVDYRREVLRRPDSDLDKSVYTTSAYGQHEVKLWNHLTGVVGVRYDHHEQTGGRFTPKVAAMYNIGNFNVRATYAAGFRAPGIDELYYHMFKKTMGTRATISLGDENLDPRTQQLLLHQHGIPHQPFQCFRHRLSELCKEHGNFQIH